MIMRHDSWFMLFWKPMITTACILSCHFYAYTSFFGLKWDKDDMSRVSQLWLLDYVFFSLFSIDIIFNFMTEFKDTGEMKPCRQFDKIWQRYLRGDFVLDLIAWLPIHYFIDYDRIYFYSWIFLLKLVRFYKAIIQFNVVKIMKIVRRYFVQRTLNIVNNDQKRAESNDEDLNVITL